MSNPLVLRLSNNPRIAAVILAAERSAALVHEELKRGLNSLALITCIAPWLGLLITLDGIHWSTPSIGTEKYTVIAIVAGRLSDAIARSALGLFVGILSMLFHRYLEARLVRFDLEMRNAILDLANRLSALPRGLKSTP